MVNLRKLLKTTATNGLTLCLGLSLLSPRAISAQTDWLLNESVTISEPAPVLASVSSPEAAVIHSGWVHRRGDIISPEENAQFRIPLGTKTLPAVEPRASHEEIMRLQEWLNEPYQNPLPLVENRRRGPLARTLLFWKPQPPSPSLTRRPPPANVIVDNDPRQADRDWDSLIASLPPEPKSPTIEIFLSRQVGRFNGYIFPALGGNRFQTPKGNFRVNFKSKDHYSQKYDAPMPYSLFFTAQCAIHQGSLYMYSHGCIHVNETSARLMFNNSTAGTTRVIVYP